MQWDEIVLVTTGNLVALIIGFVIGCIVIKLVKWLFK